MEINNQITYKETAQLLLNNGWRFLRRKGSHEMWGHHDGRRFLLDWKLDKYQSRRAKLNFIRDLRRALAGIDTMKPRNFKSSTLKGGESHANS